MIVDIKGRVWLRRPGDSMVGFDVAEIRTWWLWVFVQGYWLVQVVAAWICWLGYCTVIDGGAWICWLGYCTVIDGDGQVVVAG